MQALLPVVNQIVAVESQLGPDLTDLSTFEAETPKIAPGQLPAGVGHGQRQPQLGAELPIDDATHARTVQSADGSRGRRRHAAVPPGPANGVQAISALLEGGVA